MPASTSARAARQTGSFLQESMAGAPRLMFTTRIPYLSLFSGLVELTGFVGSAGARIQFSAFNSAEIEPVPFLSNTRRLMRFAFEAIPEYESPEEVLTPAAAPA